MPDLSLPLPILGGGVHLFVQSTLPQVCKDAITLDEIARSFLARHADGSAGVDPRAVATTVALTGVLLPADYAPHRLRSALAVKFNELLEGFGEGWFNEWFEPKVFPAVQAVVRGSAGALGLYESARVARKHGRLKQAEAEFNRAAELAEASDDWDTAVRAYLGLGNVRRQAGNLPDAHGCYRLARAVAKRHRLRKLEAIAHHEIFVTYWEVGDTDAEEHAHAALDAYGDDEDGLMRLAMDVAGWRMAQGNYVDAASALRVLLPRIDDQLLRMTQLANYARAVGNLGERVEFDATWDATWAAVSLSADKEEVAQALLDLAHGAAALGNWDRAALAADASVTVAQARGEARVLLEAESVQESIRAGRQLELLRPARKGGRRPREGTLVKALGRKLLTT